MDVSLPLMESGSKRWRLEMATGRELDATCVPCNVLVYRFTRALLLSPFQVKGHGVAVRCAVPKCMSATIHEVPPAPPCPSTAYSTHVCRRGGTVKGLTGDHKLRTITGLICGGTSGAVSVTMHWGISQSDSGG